MSIGAIYSVLLFNPTINVLLLFIFIFNTWHIPGAFGWAIIALTAFIRLLLNPLFAKQMKTARDIELLRPKLEALNLKYKKDKQQLQKEQLKLYQDNGINPASGCVTGLVQMPVFIALYQVLQLFLVNHNLAQVVEKVNKAAYFPALHISTIDPWFLGFKLGVAPSQFQKFGWYYLLIPVVTAILQYFQISLQTPGSATRKKAATDGKKPEKSDDMQSVMTSQMKFMFPLMIGYFSFVLPSGLALYWNIFSLFSILNGKNI